MKKKISQTIFKSSIPHSKKVRKEKEKPTHRFLYKKLHMQSVPSSSQWFQI
jgi:hypothetical protein